jgi:hypothetical protein
MNKKIQFISTVEGLEDIEECRPKPAKHFIPQWFKDMQSETNNAITVKKCPSFPDYFSQGYVLPMWTDVKLKSDGHDWAWETPTNKVRWDNHENSQFLNYVKTSFNGTEGQFVFKAICPWVIVTPPGWSVLQLPLFYHFNQEWSVLPGVIDTDIHSQINQQVLYHGNGKEITIKSGDPFVLYIPFKRSNQLKHEIRYQTQDDIKKLNEGDFKFRRSFTPRGVYREMQRERDKGK